jgi:hypothetical protein
MIKSGIAVAAVALAGLFVYFYAAKPADVSRSDKAKQAAIEVGDAVRDKGVAGLVDVRLKTKFGLDATRFLHTYFDNGNVVVYGLVPAGMDVQVLHDEAAKVPGVARVELLVQTRPDYIAPLPSIMGEEPKPQPGSPTPPQSPQP